MSDIIHKLRCYKWTPDYKQGVEELNALSELASARGSAACGTVVMLRLPISIRELNKLNETLRAIYGPDLTMQENPKGWLDIRTPKPPNSDYTTSG